MKQNFIDTLIKEISLLESWIRTSNYGGWSTHLNDPMEKRRLELVDILYKLEHER